MITKYFVTIFCIINLVGCKEAKISKSPERPLVESPIPSPSPTGMPKKNKYHETPFDRSQLEIIYNKIKSNSEVILCNENVNGSKIDQSPYLAAIIASQAEAAGVGNNLIFEEKLNLVLSIYKKWFNQKRNCLMPFSELTYEDLALQQY